MSLKSPTLFNVYNRYYVYGVIKPDKFVPNNFIRGGWGGGEFRNFKKIHQSPDLKYHFEKHSLLGLLFVLN